MPGASPYERDVKFEDSLRPGSFDEFIGQKKAVANLQVAIKAARKRKEALDHVLFSGLPGLGKTTLARLIAFEMQAQLHTTMGPILKRPGDLVGTLTKMEEGDVLFIDECHRMLPDVEEFLYSAMEDFQISISMESGLLGRTINLPLKKFTLVGATPRARLGRGEVVQEDLSHDRPRGARNAGRRRSGPRGYGPQDSQGAGFKLG